MEKPKEEKDNKYDLTFKMLTIGSTTVGKTCLLVRITEDRFFENIISTVGIDFQIKDIIIDKKLIQVKIWDTAGQEKYQNLTQQYYKNAQGILLMFDVNVKETFNKVSDWMDDIKKENKINTQIVLIGNKIDINKRKVTKEEGIKKAEEYGIKYFETSAKTGENIKEMFEELVRDLIIAFPPKTINENEKKDNDFNCSARMVIDGKNKAKNKKKNCC